MNSFDPNKMKLSLFEVIADPFGADAFRTPTSSQGRDEEHQVKTPKDIELED